MLNGSVSAIINAVARFHDDHRFAVVAGRTKLDWQMPFDAAEGYSRSRTIIGSANEHIFNRRKGRENGPASILWHAELRRRGNETHHPMVLPCAKERDFTAKEFARTKGLIFLFSR